MAIPERARLLHPLWAGSGTSKVKHRKRANTTHVYPSVGCLLELLWHVVEDADALPCVWRQVSRLAVHALAVHALRPLLLVACNPGVWFEAIETDSMS